MRVIPMSEHSEADVTPPSGATSSPAGEPSAGSVAPEMASGVAGDPTFVRRLKALLATSPLHELESSKTLREGGWSSLDLTGLSLVAIDVVVDHMGLVGSGIDVESLTDALYDLVASQKPDLDRGEARRVAGEVLATLLNEAENRRKFSRTYADPGDAYERKLHQFRLLEERDDPEQGVVLAASREAVNLIKVALDQDLEDAQVANAAVLRSQLQRGRIDAATTTAREAQRLSNLYADHILRVLETTRRDCRRAGWDGQVPELLDDALEHLEHRLRDTNDLIDHAQRHLEALGIDQAATETTAGHEVRRAFELVDLLSGCRRTHEALHAHLITARPVFLAEQDRQVFARPSVLVDFDPWGELLEPVLELQRPIAERVVASFLTAVMGPRVPRSFRLSGLVAALLRPPSTRAAELPDVEPELVHREVVDHKFSDATQAAALDLLGGVAAPTRLSQLLARARSYPAPDVDHLVTLLALRWFAPEADKEGDELGGFLRRGFGAVRVCVDDDGTALGDPIFGGADLLVAPDVKVTTSGTGRDG